MDVVISRTSEHEVRYVSDRTVHVEALVDGQWLGRGWGAEGEARLLDPPLAAPAFEIGIKEHPDATANTSLSTGWTWVGASDAPRTNGNCRHFIVELSSTICPIGLKVHTRLDGTAVLTRWLQITNASDHPLALAAVSPWAGRLWHQDAPITMGGSTYKTDQMTGSFGWRSLETGTTTIRTTLEPCYDDPFFMLRNESNGEYFFGQLAWPSIYMLAFEKDRGLTFSIGPIAPDRSVQRVIAPGETITTPAVHLCHLKGDFDATVQAMHEHIRRSVVPSRNPDFSFRIEYAANADTGEALYRGDEFTEANLRPCVDVAEAVGAELVFANGPYWAQGIDVPRDSSMGDPGLLEDRELVDWDWLEASKDLFPNGIKPLSDYAHEKGLLFGLYARTEGRTMLTRPGSSMFTTVCDMIDTHGLDHYGHDTSVDQWNQHDTDWACVVNRDGFQECILWRHHDVFYDTTERIHKKYPNLILWQAHAGGARLDLATIGRWHEHLQSDLTGVPLAYHMAAGFSVYLPPEVMKCAYYGMLGDLPDATTLKRCVFALGHVPVVYWTLLPANVSDDSHGDIDQWRKYVDLYKTFIRPLLSTCKVYHHEPINAKGNWDTGNWLVLEFIAPDAARGWATIVSYPDSESLTYQFRPKGLNAQRDYTVTFDGTGRTETIAGSVMMTEGIPIEVTAEIRSELLLFEAQEPR